MKSRKSEPISGKNVENLVGREKQNLKYKGKTNEIVKTSCTNFGKNRGSNLGVRKIQNLKYTGKTSHIVKKCINVGKHRGKFNLVGWKKENSKYSENKLTREHKPHQPATK